MRAEYALIAPALDAGSGGVMAPMVETADQARVLVESVRYPPLGRRGFGVLMSDELADGPGARAERANRENVVIAQIESPQGIENADEILAVPGIDVVWLGQFDLSLGLGVPGRFDHPTYLDAVDHLVARRRGAGDPARPAGRVGRGRPGDARARLPGARLRRRVGVRAGAARVAGRAAPVNVVPAAELSTAEFLKVFNSGFSDYVVPLRLDASALRAHLRENDIELDRSPVAVAEEPAAFALLGIRGRDAWIGGMATVPAHRRAGLGRRMLDAAIDSAAEAGCTTVWLEVVDRNAAAAALYRARGFAQVRDLVVWSVPAAADGGAEARAVDEREAAAWIAAHREEREPWQRADGDARAAARGRRRAARARAGTVGGDRGRARLSRRDVRERPPARGGRRRGRRRRCCGRRRATAASTSRTPPPTGASRACSSVAARA